MTRPHYEEWTPDVLLYAKPAPIDDEEAGDPIDAREIERGEGVDSQYEFADVGDGYYTIHIQAGEAKAITDKIIGHIPPAAAVSGASAIISVSDDDPTLSIDDDCLKLRSGDDYQDDRAIRVDLETTADLTGKYLIVAALRSNVTKFSYRVPIAGSAGDHHAMIDPPSTITCEWSPDRYAGLIRIEHDTGKEQTIWEGTVVVSAFPTPPAAE